jgi:hypothetical protein
MWVVWKPNAETNATSISLIGLPGTLVSASRMPLAAAIPANPVLSVSETGELAVDVDGSPLYLLFEP